MNCYTHNPCQSFNWHYGMKFLQTTYLLQALTKKKNTGQKKECQNARDILTFRKMILVCF
jgi:hypothetical protein